LKAVTMIMVTAIAFFCSFMRNPAIPTTRKLLGTRYASLALCRFADPKLLAVSLLAPAPFVQVGSLRHFAYISKVKALAYLCNRACRLELFRSPDGAFINHFPLLDPGGGFSFRSDMWLWLSEEPTARGG
jgi:hypothetical protein